MNERKNNEYNCLQCLIICAGIAGYPIIPFVYGYMYFCILHAGLPRKEGECKDDRDGPSLN